MTRGKSLEEAAEIVSGPGRGKDFIEATWLRDVAENLFPPNMDEFLVRLSDAKRANDSLEDLLTLPTPLSESLQVFANEGVKVKR